MVVDDVNSIGGALNKGGPAGMLLAYTFYSCLLALVSNGAAEMTTYMPVSGGYVRLAGAWVDEAFGELGLSHIDQEWRLLNISALTDLFSSQALWLDGISTFTKRCLFHSKSPLSTWCCLSGEMTFLSPLCAQPALCYTGASIFPLFLTPRRYGFVHP